MVNIFDDPRRTGTVVVDKPDCVNKKRNKGCLSAKRLMSLKIWLYAGKTVDKIL